MTYIKLEIDGEVQKSKVIRFSDGSITLQLEYDRMYVVNELRLTLYPTLTVSEMEVVISQFKAMMRKSQIIGRS